MILLASALLLQSAGGEAIMSRAELERTDPRAIGVRLLGRRGDDVRHRRFCDLVPGSACTSGGPDQYMLLSTTFKRTAVATLCASQRYFVPIQRRGKAEVSVSTKWIQSSAWYRVADRCGRRTPGFDGLESDFSVEGTDEIKGLDAARLVLSAAADARDRIVGGQVTVTCEPKRSQSSHACDSPVPLLDRFGLAALRRASIVSPAEGEGPKVSLDLWRRPPGARPIPTQVDLFVNRLPTRADPRTIVTRVVTREYFLVD